MADLKIEENPDPTDNTTEEDDGCNDNIVESIPDQLKPILKDLPEEQQKVIINAVIENKIQHSSSLFKGPVPPPDILEGYNKVVINGAERILSMAEKQSYHRMQLENYAIKGEIKQSKTGQIFAFVLAILGLGLATFLEFYDHTTIAGILASTTIVGLVTVFIIGKKAQRKDLEEKK